MDEYATYAVRKTSVYLTDEEAEGLRRLPARGPSPGRAHSRGRSAS